MKAKNEFRIGNIFFKKGYGYELEVEGITSMGINTTSITGEGKTVRFDDVVFSPITDLWLKEIGLRQVPYMIDGCFYLPGEKYIIGIFQSDGNRTIEVVLGDDEFFITNRCNFKHQLQNLYYDFTGKDLIAR